MTGEASPGYVAYSEVPPRVFSKLPQARILVVVRDPASRAFSSYNYNYVSLAKGHALPFTDIVRAEIRFLQRCITDFEARARGPDARRERHVRRERRGRGLVRAVVVVGGHGGDAFEPFGRVLREHLRRGAERRGEMGRRPRDCSTGSRRSRAHRRR